jgi:1,2-phenylacetyl-CoA epoxidase catalytic subunit
MATTSIRVAETPLVLYALRRADDALILGHRLSQWIGRGPTLEEEMAFGNFGLDLIGQARALYAYAAAIAAKSEKESAYHFSHAAEWVIRLGDGTAESHARTETACEALWPFTGEMFESDAAERELCEAGVIIDPASLRAPWRARLGEVFAAAGLALPAPDRWMQRGGRSGRHSEHLGHLLAEMQILPRSFPGAEW